MTPEQPPEAQSTKKLPTLNDIRAFAGRLLARREYSVKELHSRLLQKWAGSEHIEASVAELIDRLQDEGAVSDERFTEAFIRSRLQRCHGPAKIHAELRQRQVPEPLIVDKLQPLEDEWVPLAAGWLARQFSGPMDYAVRAKYYRRLTNRGFSHQQAMAALAGRDQSAS